MPKVFLSYSRKDQATAAALAQDVKSLGYEVWFDQDLSGGQEWWEMILDSVRECGLFVFALSADSLDSLACKREYKYAEALGKTILPILVGSGVKDNLLPPALSKIQFVDYSCQERESVFKLARALNKAPTSLPLPELLPKPPAVPLSYLGSLAEKIDTTSSLSFEEQSGLLFDLKRGLKNSVAIDDSLTLLTKLRARDDLYAKIADEVDKLTVSIPNKNIYENDGETTNVVNKNKKRVKLVDSVSIKNIEDELRGPSLASTPPSPKEKQSAIFVNAVKERILTRLPIGALIGVFWALMVMLNGENFIHPDQLDTYQNYISVGNDWFWMALSSSVGAFIIFVLFYSNVGWKNLLIPLSGVITISVIHLNFKTYGANDLLPLFCFILPSILALTIVIPVVLYDFSLIARNFLVRKS